MKPSIKHRFHLCLNQYGKWWFPPFNQNDSVNTMTWLYKKMSHLQNGVCSICPSFVSIKLNLLVVGGFNFNPFEKYAVVKFFLISPVFGVKIIKIFELPPPSNTRLDVFLFGPWSLETSAHLPHPERRPGHEDGSNGSWTSCLDFCYGKWKINKKSISNLEICNISISYGWIYIDTLLW